MSLVFTEHTVLAFLSGVFMVATVASAVWGIRRGAKDPIEHFLLLIPTIIPLGILAIAFFVGAFRP